MTCRQFVLARVLIAADVSRQRSAARNHWHSRAKRMARMNLRGAAEILVGSTYQPVNDLPNSTRDEIINVVVVELADVMLGVHRGL